MPPIISFANQKGGVGKTTTTINIADLLASMGIKTLAVDLDPQGHIAYSFGRNKEPGLYNLICMEQPLSKVVTRINNFLDIVPGDKNTEKVKRLITISDFREGIVSDIFSKAPYDVILIDMAPSLDVLHVNGLLAADWVVIPTKLDVLAIDGVNEILNTMTQISNTGHKFSGYSVLPTFFERTTNETLIQFKNLVEVFQGRVWAPIPQDTRVRECAAYGKTLSEYAPTTSAMQGILEKGKKRGGYINVLNKILEVINGCK